MDRNIGILSWFNFFTDFKLFAPVAIIYFARVSGSYALGMSIFSITMISSALFEVPTGVFSDRIGRKMTVICGALAAVAYALLYASATSYPILILGAIAEGLSRAFYSGNNDALVYDSVAARGRVSSYASVLGRTSAMFQAALAVSSLFGGFVADWSFRLVMWVSVLPQILCLFLAFRLEEPPKRSPLSGNAYAHLGLAFRNFLSNRKLMIISLSSMFGYGFGEASYLFQSAFYATLWPIWAIGIAKTLSHLGATLSFRLSGRVLGRWNAYRVFLVDSVWNRMVNTVSLVFPTVLSPLIMSTTSLLFGISTIAKSSLLQQEFTPTERATMGSLNSFGGSVFFGVVSFGIGLVADRFSPAGALLLLQGLHLVNLSLYIWLFRQYGRSGSTVKRSDYYPLS